MQGYVGIMVTLENKRAEQAEHEMETGCMKWVSQKITNIVVLAFVVVLFQGYRAPPTDLKLTLLVNAFIHLRIKL